MKKLFSVVVSMTLVLLVLFGIFGCKPAGVAPKETTGAEETKAEGATSEATEQPSGEPIKLTLWDWQNAENYLKAIGDILDLYKKNHPELNIEFEHKGLAYDEYTQQIKTALTGGTAPDIFEVYPGAELIEMAKSGTLVNINANVMGDEEWKKWLGPSVDLPENKYNGELYQVPVDVFAEAIYYYKDFGSKYGLTEPKTLEDLISMVPLLAKDNKVVLISGLADQWLLYEPFYCYIQQQTGGKNLIQDVLDGKASWTDPIFANAINAIKKMYDAGIWKKDVLSLNYNSDAIGQFLGKEGWGFWEAGDWYIGTMNKEDLDSDNIGIMPFPVINENAKPIYLVGTGLSYAVGANAPNKEVAIDVIKFFSSPEASQIFISNLIHPAGSVEGAKSDIPLFQKGLEIYASSDVLKGSPYINPDADLTKAIGDGITNILLGKETTDGLLKQLDEMTKEKIGE
ncbi:MAG: extracellular solute-binding protein [Actinobacteria bacterium]|nr:extracellular solute-binding protein [Actinomycetota bacterium]